MRRSGVRFPSRAPENLRHHGAQGISASRLTCAFYFALRPTPSEDALIRVVGAGDMDVEFLPRVLLW